MALILAKPSKKGGNSVGKLLNYYHENSKYLAHFFVSKIVFNAQDVKDFLKKNYTDIKWNGKVFCSDSKLNVQNSDYIGPGGTYEDYGHIETFADHIISENGMCATYEMYYDENGEINSKLFQISNCGFYELADDGRKIVQNLTAEWQDLLLNKYKDAAADQIKTFNGMCLEDLTKSVGSVNKQIDSLISERNLLMAEMAKLTRRNKDIEKMQRESEAEKGE